MHEARRKGRGPGLVVLALCILAPPLGLLAWVLASGEDRQAYLRSWWVRTGLALLLIGSAPLLFIILTAQVGLWPDPNPNPVGAGMLFFFAAVMATICLAIGAVWVRRDLGRLEPGH
jgi:hypothetical protein